MTSINPRMTRSQLAQMIKASGSLLLLSLCFWMSGDPLLRRAVPNMMLAAVLFPSAIWVWLRYSTKQDADALKSQPSGDLHCPKCGSSTQRAMTNGEIDTYMGRSKLVLFTPRLCLDCQSPIDVSPMWAKRLQQFFRKATLAFIMFVSIALPIAACYLIPKSKPDQMFQMILGAIVLEYYSVQTLVSHFRSSTKHADNPQAT